MWKNNNVPHILKDFYNMKDTTGTTHNGFLTAMNFTGLQFDILNDVTISILDNYIYNRLSELIALKQWNDYLKWDPDVKERRIDATFYADFVSALHVELLTADKVNTDILKYNFTSISAKDLKKISFGEKVTDRNYDNVLIELKRNNDTEGTTARTDTHSSNQVTDTHTDANAIDTHGTTARTDHETPGTVTTTGKVYPLGASAYVDDTQTIQSTTQSTMETGAQTVTDNIGQRQRTDVIGARQDTDITGAQTLTKTYGDQTTETKEREDTETIHAHIDNEEHTKHVIITPEKYFEIQRELASINAYTVLGDAVRRTFSAAAWGVML